jgi:hypothetical protein
LELETVGREATGTSIKKHFFCKFAAGGYGWRTSPLVMVIWRMAGILFDDVCRIAVKPFPGVIHKIILWLLHMMVKRR